MRIAKNTICLFAILSITSLLAGGSADSLAGIKGADKTIYNLYRENRIARRGIPPLRRLPGRLEVQSCRRQGSPAAEADPLRKRRATRDGEIHRPDGSR